MTAVLVSSVAAGGIETTVAQLGQGSPVLYLHDVLFDLVSDDGAVPRVVERMADHHLVIAPSQASVPPGLTLARLSLQSVDTADVVLVSSQARIAAPAP